MNKRMGLEVVGYVELISFHVQVKRFIQALGLTFAEEEEEGEAGGSALRGDCVANMAERHGVA